jgi:ABC-type transporter Mla maintaining outer membrane lipid asymmetry permease subunit MlaE
VQWSDPSLCDWLWFDGVMPSGRKNMLLLAMISLLVGAVLAQRFKIMILIPATEIMLVAAVGAGVAQAHAVWWTILTIAAAGASMQLGYVIGLGILHILEAPTVRAEAFRPGTSGRHPVR